MNIITRPYGSTFCCCRPDTTWERENRDFYSPECVNAIFWTPVIFARISKAGKCIGERFAERYYDGFNFGALLYCLPGPEMTSADIAFASCIDHTSLLPMPLYNPAVNSIDDNIFEVFSDGRTLYDCNSGAKMKALLEETICKASELTSLRIGDFIVAELERPVLLASRSEGDSELKAVFCGNDLFTNKIIF